MAVVRANETSREELLERDVYIQFNELRELRAEIKKLKATIKQLKSENKTLKAGDDLPEELGYFIQQQRMALGYSTRNFAALMGVSQVGLMNIEKGQPNSRNAHKIIDKIREGRKNGTFRRN